MSESKPHLPADSPASEATKPKAKMPPPQGSKAPTCGTPTPDGTGRVYKTGIWVSKILRHRMNPDCVSPQTHSASESSPIEPIPVVTSRVFDTTIWTDGDSEEALDRILQASIAKFGLPSPGPRRG